MRIWCWRRRRASVRRATMRDSSSRSSRGRLATHSRPRCTAQGHEQLPITLLYGHAEDALRAADVGIVASGTATLEAALARCPHVIFYRVSALTGRIVGTQAAAAVRRTAQRARRRVRRARIPAGRCDTGQSGAGCAQPVRRHGDAADDWRHFSQASRRSCPPTRARWPPTAVLAELRLAGAAC